jgi:sterol desaturase/sphingolipid hydroxylase (fatty acid hydroxylase superfamily)
VMAIDLGKYAQHRLLHAVPLLWRFHQIHHSDLDVDIACSTRSRCSGASTRFITRTSTWTAGPPFATTLWSLLSGRHWTWR